MKTPLYWQHKNFYSTVLTPLGLVYGLLTKLRLRFKRGYKAPVLVICVGNILAGGVGKTPLSVALAKLLQEKGKKPFFLSRGYGGKLQGVLVDDKKHTPFDVGDEPLILAKTAPTVVFANRAKGAKIAVQNGADVLIMDDGFQNPGLQKDISFLVFNGALGIGNQKIIPAGPLRESFASGMSRANAVFFIGEDKHNLQNRINKPIFKVQIKEKKPVHPPSFVVAFAGIGYPQKFYQSLENCGMKVVKSYDFADHHFYQKEELNEILAFAKSKKLPVYTTSKDFVKIPKDMQKHFCVLEIEAVFENKKELLKFLSV